MSDCKYQKLRKYISYDMGATWNALEPAEYQKGELIEYQSKDCGIIPPKPFIYRWVDTTGYICSGYDKYNRQKKQYSDDSGLSWQDVSPEQYRMGSTLLEANSEDCGYVPPTNFKFQGIYTNNTYEVACNSSSTLTPTETRRDSHVAPQYQSVIIGDCVTEIAENAFNYYCLNNILSSVTISDNVTTIGNSAFTYCSGVTSFDLPSGLTTIGDDAFRDCFSLTGITIPNSVTSIGEYAFFQCSAMTTAILSTGITMISDCLFSNCYNLTGITIPSSVTYVGQSSFLYCSSLSSVTIPEGVLYIRPYAFQGCSSLTSVTLPSTIEDIDSSWEGQGIGVEAFEGCTRLQSITILATTPPRVDIDAFDNTNNCPIYVPAGSVNAYKNVWSDYTSRIQAIP